MPEEELAEEEEREERPKKGLPKGPVMVFLLVVIGLIIAGVTAAVVAKIMAEKQKIPPIPIVYEEGVEHLKEEVALCTYELGEFLAKLQTPEEPIYVKVEKIALAYPEEYEFLPAELKERKYQIRDIVNDLLISSTPEIGTIEGKKAFKDKLLHQINSILRDGQIKEIYCELIVQ
jgi:flagellar basal body-associated protein FliL